jgi:hypothetical protein
LEYLSRHLETALGDCPGLTDVSEHDVITILETANSRDTPVRPPVLLRAAAQWIGAGIGQREVRVRFV